MPTWKQHPKMTYLANGVVSEVDIEMNSIRMDIETDEKSYDIIIPVSDVIAQYVDKALLVSENSDKDLKICVKIELEICDE